MSGRAVEPGREAPVDDQFLRRLQEEHSGYRDHTYLDTASIGLVPRRAVRALWELARTSHVFPEESGTARYASLARELATARDAAARLIGARPEHVALVESTADGVAAAVRAIPLEDGAEVAVCELELAQGAPAWSRASERGVKIRQLTHRDGTVWLDTIREALDRGARAVSVSAVHAVSGSRLDLAAVGELCRASGAWLVVDATHQLGALPLDVVDAQVDVLTGGGHTWLNAPFGTGLLYLSPRLRERSRRPIGGPGEPGDASALPRPWEAREARGAPNASGAVGLAAGLSLIEDLGVVRVAEHIDSLTAQLAIGLQSLDVTIVSPREPERRSGIVTFSLGPRAADLAAGRWLLDAGVAVSVRHLLGIGGVRVSCHYFNTPQHIDHLLDCLREFLECPDPTSVPAPGPRSRGARHLDELDELDEEIAALIALRGRLAPTIRGSKTDLAREQRTIARYRGQLGRPGVRIALEILRAQTGVA